VIIIARAKSPISIYIFKHVTRSADTKESNPPPSKPVTGHRSHVTNQVMILQAVALGTKLIDELTTTPVKTNEVQRLINHIL
jgi:hypothetical protein